jgi:hypothetical protein
MAAELMVKGYGSKEKADKIIKLHFGGWWLKP